MQLLNRTKKDEMEIARSARKHAYSAGFLLIGVNRHVLDCHGSNFVSSVTSEEHKVQPMTRLEAIDGDKEHHLTLTRRSAAAKTLPLLSDPLAERASSKI
jgi:hypothetical protein